MNDTIMLLIVAICGPLLLIAFISFVLHYFVALKSKPTRRALWTAGLTYVFTSLILLFSLPADQAFYGPLAAIPGALVAFLFWKKDFQRDWIESADDLPEGAELLDDDWRIGLLRLAILITVVVGIGFYKWIMRSM